MKTTAKTPTITKLVARFDNELKSLIMEDLKTIKRTKDEVMDKIAKTVSGNHLSAA